MKRKIIMIKTKIGDEEKLKSKWKLFSQKDCRKNIEE